VGRCVRAVAGGAPEALCVGRSGTVRLDARFDAGYFVSVRVAGQDFRGMLYYPPACQARRPAGGHPRALSVSTHASTRAARSAAWLRAGRPVHARACTRPLPSMPRRACSRAHEALQERALLYHWHALRLRGVIHSAGWLPVLSPVPPASQPPAQRVRLHVMLLNATICGGRAPSIGAVCGLRSWLPPWRLAQLRARAARGWRCAPCCPPALCGRGMSLSVKVCHLEGLVACS